MHCAALIGFVADGADSDQLPSPREMIDVCKKAVKLLPGSLPATEALAFLQKHFGHSKSAIHTLKLFLINYGAANSTNTAVIQNSLINMYLESDSVADAELFIHQQVDENPSFETYEMAYKLRSLLAPRDDPLTLEYKKNATLLAISAFTASDPRICKDLNQWSLANDYVHEAELHPDILSIDRVYPRTNVIRFKSGASMSGNHGLISHDCKIYSGSHSFNIDTFEFPGTDESVAITEVDDPVFTMITPRFHTDYFSWFTETIPKMVIARQLILKDLEYSKAKIMIPTEGISDHIDDFLYLPGNEVLDGRLLFYPTTPTPPLLERFYFKNSLYTIDFTANDIVDSPTTSTTIIATPKDILQKARTFLHQEVKTVYEFYPRHEITNTQQGTLVLLTSTPFGNQHKVILHLQNRFGHRVVFNSGREPLLEQGARFAAARVVVGVQGDPMLANYVMCQEGAGVILIPRGVEVREKSLVEEMGGEVVMFQAKGLKEAVGGYNNNGKRLGELSDSILDLLVHEMDMMFNRVMERTLAQQHLEDNLEEEEEEGFVHSEL
ncbi:hypothetical protein BDR26DRAFT_865842 [Obelidium mucronatum]|nr:hypothetical protein BDR26DRAFT_865842 [Obelidium mucronatum]